MGYFILSKKLKPLDAAAIAATYGSISAVTFITASQSLDQAGIHYGGHMAAAMAFMESPAIIIAVVIASFVRKQNEKGKSTEGAHGVGAVLKHALTDGAQIVLIGALLVGVISGEAGKAAMAPFSVDLFKGMLAFFLLDMGLTVAKSLGSSNPYNMVRATFDALRLQQSPRLIAQRRGKSVAEIIQRREGVGKDAKEAAAGA